MFTKGSTYFNIACECTLLGDFSVLFKCIFFLLFDLKIFQNGIIFSASVLNKVFHICYFLHYVNFQSVIILCNDCGK